MTRMGVKRSPTTTSREVDALGRSIRATVGNLKGTLRSLDRQERAQERERRRLQARARKPSHKKLPACGARCRDGHACRRKCIPWRERCALHGGLSTGPKTAQGKATLAEALRERWARWRRGEGPRPGRGRCEKIDQH
jgi:hypothetical protein